MNRLQGKSILITGATRGQGEIEARLFAREGARVYLTDVLDDAGKVVAQSIREGVATLSICAWTSPRKEIGLPLRTTSAEQWERIHRINLLGPFLGIKLLAPLLKSADGASVVNVGSAAGMTGTFTTAYASSK